jgi:Pup amidohydrolase
MMRSIKARNTSTKRKLTAKANDFQLLDRLIGVETEYAFRYGVPSNRNSQSLYRILTSSFAARMPLVESYRNPNRSFLANGGSISWEPSLNTLMGYRGFVEIATPQCRNPRQVVAYLSAFDHLIADALEDPLVNGESCVPQAAIRNNCDGFGQRYGQQENYEVEIADGIWLYLWWFGLAMLLPVLIMHRMVAKVILFFTVCFPFSSTSEGDIDKEQDIESEFVSRRIRIAAKMLEWCHWPLETCFQALCMFTLLHRHRRILGLFLASRVAFDGSGHVDRMGNFRISSRAMQVNAYIGFSGNGHDKPMIDLHHWFRSLCLDDSWSLKAYRKLFHNRQRIQICCGDTSTNEFIRWLQIGSTCLVLDMIESDINCNLPSFKSSPDRLIQRFSCDTELTQIVTARDRTKWTALTLQEAIIKRIRKSFMSRSRVPLEAWEILNAWQLLIGRLQRRNVDTQDADWLIARCDWFTKKTLLRRLPVQASFAALKKIDIRYHEVGVESYFQRLAKFRDVSPIVDANQLDRATRMPPDNSPATKRGYMIREFANSGHVLDIDWDSVEVVASKST